MPDTRPSSAADQGSIVPRKRKLRKGTLSCWECKRRKTRCSFAAPSDSVCDGCRSRQTKCTSQEFPDEIPRAERRDRLSRVESILGQLVEQQDPAHYPVGRLEVQTSRPDGSEAQDATPPGNSQRTTFSASSHAPRQPLGNPIENQLAENPDDISRALLSVWPSKHDLDLILSIPCDPSILFHGIICLPYSKILKQIPISRDILTTAPTLSHPIFVAKKLLTLSTLLQSIPPSESERLATLSIPHRTLASRLNDAVSRLFTNNDDMASSVEGIECIMIESMYLNNTGDLRRAWLRNRKALGMAQMLGIHKSKSTPRAFLDAATRERIDTEYMWFRIVCSDRYLSLMLGLPQACTGDDFAKPHVLDNLPALERMERMETVAVGLILQRNSSDQMDIALTHKIDKMLREAAALMPPQWWLSSTDLSSADRSQVSQFEESIRLTHHLTYNHLLVQLHLPYILQPSSAPSNLDYHKLSAAAASRTAISQFVSFRTCNPHSSYCRGIDFIAFIASTALCLIHIEISRQQISGSNTALQSLQHQRLRDRGLFQRTLEILQETFQANQDAISGRIADILERVLAFEQKAAEGATYHAKAEPAADQHTSEGPSGWEEAPSRLFIQIPYVGTIKIDHKPAPDQESRWSLRVSSELDVNTVSTGLADSPYRPHQQVPESTYSCTDLTDDTLLVLGNLGDSSEFPGLDGSNINDWGLLGMGQMIFDSFDYEHAQRNQEQ